VELAEGQVESVTVVGNPPHEEGGCLAPVGLLASHDVGAIVVAGIGARPLAGFEESGIVVFHDDRTPTVGGVVERLLDGGLPLIDPGTVCGGH
jgi:predicted Fe-Mo cluster-binding NifX family protein